MKKTFTISLLFASLCFSQLNCFAQDNKSDWSDKAITTFIEKGLLLKDDNIDGAITRGEIAQIIKTALGLWGIVEDIEQPIQVVTNAQIKNAPVEKYYCFVQFEIV